MRIKKGQVTIVRPLLIGEIGVLSHEGKG